jgi:hypothetical protein
MSSGVVHKLGPSSKKRAADYGLATSKPQYRNTLSSRFIKMALVTADSTIQADGPTQRVIQTNGRSA